MGLEAVRKVLGTSFGNMDVPKQATIATRLQPADEWAAVLLKTS